MSKLDGEIRVGLTEKVTVKLRIKGEELTGKKRMVCARQRECKRSAHSRKRTKSRDG